METLTKKQRLQHYRYAIKMIDQCIWFCKAMAVLYYKNEMAFFKNSDELVLVYPEIAQYKPRDVRHNSQAWWGYSYKSKRKRISILKSIINQLEKELKSNKK